jgi:hypothetical protein
VPAPPPIFQRLAPAARPAEPGTGLRVLHGGGNPMPQSAPVFHHLRGVEQAPAAVAVGRGMVTDGSVPISTAFKVEHRASNGM